MSNSDPLITVYVPCRNYGRFLGKAIQSVIEQLYKNWEMIIFNEASEDETDLIARSYAMQYPERITVFNNENPVGLQKIANQALRMAKGKYIIRLDADDWLDEGALLLMVAKLESNPALGLVYGNYYYVDQDGHLLGAERRRKLGAEDISGHLPPHGACTMVKIRELKSVGGYSEDVNAQDGWDLWFRLINRVDGAHLEAPLFYYRQHNNSMSRDTSRLLDARAQIFKQSRKRLEGGYVPSCLAVIPVRESYPDWEGVPYEEIEGRSLLHIALHSAVQSLGVTEVAVSSESQAVLHYGEMLENKFQLPHKRFLRSPTKSDASIHPRDILEQAVRSYCETGVDRPDIVLFLSIHAPMRCSKHIDKAIDILLVTRADSVVSVIQETEPMFSHDREGLKLLNPGRFDGLAYEREHLYRYNGAIVGLWSENLKDGNLFGNSISYLEMDMRSSLQLKSKNDLARFGMPTNHQLVRKHIMQSCISS